MKALGETRDDFVRLARVGSWLLACAFFALARCKKKSRSIKRKPLSLTSADFPQITADVFEAVDGGIELWRNVRVLVAIVLLVASAVPLAGQERAVTPPHHAPYQVPHQVPPAWQQPGSEGHGGVPSIIGRSAQDANAILGQHHLIGSESGQGPSAEYRPGTVIRQDPPPKAPIPDDRVVKYSLAEGPTLVPGSLVSVPDIVGLVPERGLAALTKARLVGRPANKKMSTYRFGKITRQDPPARTMVKPGSTVTVWVSDGRLTPPPDSTWDWKSFLLGIILALIATKLLRQKPQSAFQLRPVLDPGDQVLVKVGPLVKAE